MKSFCPVLTPTRVASVAALLVWFPSLLGGCEGGQSGAEVATGNGGDDPPLGGVSCQVDDECRENAQRELAQLAAPQTLNFELASSTCQAYGVFYEDRQLSGPACSCNFAYGETRTLGPSGVGCSVTGRAGECLWSDADFSGCSIADPHACDATCAELGQRLAADAARSLQTELVYAACEQGSCANVVSIDGRCSANQSYLEGKSYDCALGAQSILEASAVPVQPPTFAKLPDNGHAYYEPGTDGTVQLTVSQDYWGTARGAFAFGVKAQFVDLSGKDARYGELQDPLSGVDLCRVLRESPLAAPVNVRFLSVDRAVLRDGDQEFPLQEFRSGSDSYSYHLDLSQAGVQPRFNGRYGFSASGGTFGASVELDELSRFWLPPALSSPELETTSHFERGALALTWTGSTANTIQLLLDIAPEIDDSEGAYHIDCLVADDGAFTIPAAVLEAAPDGFVTATLRRTQRQATGRNGTALGELAEVVATHHFVLGPTCDGTALMAACLRSADAIRARYRECSPLEPPPIEQLCPDYLTTSCGSCPEYFDCLAQSTTCGSDGLTTRTGCSCTH